MFSLLYYGFIFVKPVSILLGAEGELVDICVTYGRTLLFALVPFFLQNCFQSFLIVAEKPKMGLVISIITGITNMILDFLFIYIFKMGVFGAAFATGLSQLVGGIVPVIFFIRKNNTVLKLVKTGFKLKPILTACMNGSSEMVANISMSLVNMLYNLQLMKYAGADGVVAYGIIMYVGFIFSGTYLGYATGSAPIIGYHYGANNHEEVKNILIKSLKLMGITSIVMTIMAEILSKPLANIFVGYDAELVNLTTNAIRIFAISYIISWFNIFASSFYTALNNGIISATISFLRTLIFEVSMILILPIIWGLNGIWLAIVFAESLALIVSLTFLICTRKKYGYA